MADIILFGAIKPEGWLKESVQFDMDGCIGHLDELVPELLVGHEIYGKDRLKPGSKPAALGNEAPEQGFGINDEVGFMWWNSESQSNWHDGYCRAAYLLDNPEYIAKADAFAGQILKTQDNGYLGIYSPDLRFTHSSENGELWAQCSLFRALLACYEATGEERILQAVLQAADTLMAGYPIDRSDPFHIERCDSGACHGLLIVDSLNRLTELTGEGKYLDYAVFLYERYSDNPVVEEDMKKNNILNFGYIWKGHGAHTYEHIRAVILAAEKIPEKYGELLKLVLAKLPYYLLPSGGPVGDEFIKGRIADATHTGYEYCSVLELFDTYSLLAHKTGDISWGDKMEWLYYNAGHGMKHPEESSIMYLKTDNCYSADNKSQDGSPDRNPRYMYSPTHQLTAVCCVPNMGRLTPHFVQAMLRRTKTGYDAVLFGPCVFRGQWEGVDVQIRQKTCYPADLKVTFEVTVSKPVTFALGIRKPSWASEIIADVEITHEDTRLSIRKEWCGTEEFSVEFRCDVVVKTGFNNELYVTHGPLLYALPIPASCNVERELTPKPFRELTYRPLSHDTELLRIHEKDRNSFRFCKRKDCNWNNLEIEGLFWDGSTSRTGTLKPIGGTILRKATFELSRETR